MPEKNRLLRVFLCHAHSDAKGVHALYTRLINCGVDAWLDKEKLIPGSDWAYEIHLAVHQADVVIVCLSKSFNQAGFRQKEVRLALDTAMEKPEGEIFIVPARLEECGIPENLKKWHWVDLFENNGYDRLIQTLQVRANIIGTTLPIPHPSSSPKKMTTQETLRWIQRGVGLLISLLVIIFSVYWYFQQKPSSVQLTKPVICTPQASNANIYRAALALPTLTPNSAAPNGATGINTNLSAEQVMALLQGTPLPGIPVVSAPDSNSTILRTLVNETKAWSDVQTIKLDNTSTAQIVVTFISPQLIENVHYSELSSQGYAISSAQSVLNAVAAREELIFFVTIITTTNNNINSTPHTIKIPIQEMSLVNSDNLLVPPLRTDYNLAQPINSSYEPAYGYLTYPIAMINGMDCSWILNPNYNKKIIITVTDVLVDGISAGTYTWVIPFSPLTEYFPAPQSNIAIDPNMIINSFVPPGPMTSLLVSNGVPEEIFWQKYTGFLWRQIVLGIY